MTASTRRAALGAILAAPLASLPVMAAASAVTAVEARFLALAPRVVPLLDEYDRLWEASRPFYEAYRQVADVRWRAGMQDTHDGPEWRAYEESRRRADEIDDILLGLYEPFRDERFVGFEAILLRHRFAMTFDWADDGAMGDLTALWEARRCA